MILLVAYLIYRLRSKFSAPSHLLAIRTYVFLPVYDRKTDILFFFFFNQSQCNSAVEGWEQCFWLDERLGKGWNFRCTIVQQCNCMTVWRKQILCGHFHFVRLARSDAKGQLISKCLFGVFNSPKKTNENNLTWGTIVVKSNFFVHFLGELKIPKRHFEINWPLESYDCLLLWAFEKCTSC